MDRRRVTLENIYIGNRHRSPDMAKVREIAKSISEVGLMNPPAVVFRDGIVINGEETENTPVLIYGRHRVLALQELGEVTVECIVHEVDDLHAELMEIDENLARAELSPAQEAAHIARRRVIWGQINETGEENFTTSLSDGRLSGPQHQKRFAAELAEITGEDKSGINRKLKRVDSLKDDIRRIAGTSLDKGVEMDALIKLPEPERKQLIDRAAAGEKVSARPAPEPKPIRADKALNVMLDDLNMRADAQQFEDTEFRDIAEDVIERFGRENMPYLLTLLDGNPRKLAAAIRRQL